MREKIRELVIEAITDPDKLTDVVDKLCDLHSVSGSLSELLAEFLVDTNKKGTIGRGKYTDIATDFLKRKRNERMTAKNLKTIR